MESEVQKMQLMMQLLSSFEMEKNLLSFINLLKLQENTHCQNSRTGNIWNSAAILQKIFCAKILSN